MPARTVADACPGVFAPHDAADGALARIRLPGGAISSSALRVIADCADELGDGRVHLTSRGNLQLRGLSRTPALARRLAAAGLLPSTTHERVRNVLASPLSGVAGDPVARVAAAGGTTVGTRGSRSCDVRGLAAALDRGLCARPVLAELPGRFLFALDDGRGDVAAEDPDLCWRAPGVLLVAGVDTGLRVPFDDAVTALLDAAEAFLALRAADAAGGGGADGNAANGRANGSGTGGSGGAWRAAELADGPARIAAMLGARTPWEDGHLHTTERPEGGLPPTGAAAPGPVPRDDGGTALVVAPLLGELTAAQVRLLADATPRSGAAVVTPWRTVVLPDPCLPATALAAGGLLVDHGPAAQLSACAGRPGCAKALADVRGDARAALGRMPRVGLPQGRVHVSGCARRCGAPRTPHVDAVALAGGGYEIDGVSHPGLAR
ncbi:MAG: precorrin-3B synthase [Pseudonocardiales bacterium]|nr:precorrin-3B synthase [Pseudonocardiales bacterium]